MRLHFYKLNKRYYDEVYSGRKNFEVRKFDRKINPKEGDVAIFAEWFENDRVQSVVPHFTGRRMLAGIGFVLEDGDARNLGLFPPFAVFGLRRASLAQVKYAVIHASEVMPEGLSKKVKPMPKIKVPAL